MRRVVSEGIIYKIIKYSDSSAIAFSFLKDYGKVKLFINKAFTKKKGLNKFLPGEIDFQKKDESDLNKCYGIKYDTSKSYFIENPEIFIRLNIVFNVIDILYYDDEQDETLFKYIYSLNEKNMSRWTIYVLNFILKKQGIGKSYDFCEKCGENVNKIVLHKGMFSCEKCEYDGLHLSKECTKILQKVYTQEFKELAISKEDEISILEFLLNYIESVTSKKIKGLSVLKELG
ncbi:MAG: hypothetical protein JG762_1004 [Deferribacteraceae bacterium]|nr:hypothetical protein [Deferribacteraceae bacterium]